MELSVLNLKVAAPACPSELAWTVEGISDHALTLQTRSAGRTVTVDLLVMPSDRVAITGGSLAVVKEVKKGHQLVKKLGDGSYQVYVSRTETFSDHDKSPFVLRAEVTAQGGSLPPQSVHFFAPVTTWDDVRAALEGGVPPLVAEMGLPDSTLKLIPTSL